LGFSTAAVDASVDSAGLFSVHPVKQIAPNARAVIRIEKNLLIIVGFCFIVNINYIDKPGDGIMLSRRLFRRVDIRKYSTATFSLQAKKSA